MTDTIEQEVTATAAGNYGFTITVPMFDAGGFDGFYFVTQDTANPVGTSYNRATIRFKRLA